jgi:hypothetical protein
LTGSDYWREASAKRKQREIITGMVLSVYGVKRERLSESTLDGGVGRREV